MTGKPLSEKQIHQAVMAHWKARGKPNTLVATIPNARAFGQPGLTQGLPDLIVIGGSAINRVAFLELKTERGKLSPAQEAFRDLCIAVGVDYAVPRGLDQALHTLELWGIIKPVRAS